MFWWTMFGCNLLIPILMVIFGGIMWKRCPKEINGVFGYRTGRSMKNMDTWRFAHDFCGRFWVKAGAIAVLPTVLIQLPYYHDSSNVISGLAVLIELLQCAVMIWSIAATEKALKKEFTDDGERRQIGS